MSGKRIHKACGCPITRRKFIENTAITAVALAMRPSDLFAAGPVTPWKKSPVVVAEDLKAITNGFVIEARRVRTMIDEGIKALTGAGSTKEGWMSIFPGLKEHEVIGLKVNSVNPKIPAHPEVAHAIVDSMVAAGISMKNILIWDNVDKFLTNSGYTINTGDEGYRCYGTYHDKSIWLDPAATVRIPSQNITRTYSRILSQHIDYLINVPVLKSADFPGVTLSLKNMYGTISLSEQATLNIFPPDMGEVVVKMHAHNCDPQIAEVNAGDLLMKKTRLVVLDALMGIYEGNAHVPPQGVNHKIVMSRDRVATDVTGFNIINAERKKRGIPLITKQKAGHIWSAEKLGIGNAQQDRIELRDVRLRS